jgi:hypothetical protein
MSTIHRPPKIVRIVTRPTSRSMTLPMRQAPHPKGCSGIAPNDAASSSSLGETTTIFLHWRDSADRASKSRKRPSPIGMAASSTSIAQSEVPPLHKPLPQDAARPLVMTSGNLSDEPQVIEDDEARER